MWENYKSHALKTENLKTLRKEMLRLENNLLPKIKDIDMETIKHSSKARPIFLTALQSIQEKDNPKTETVRKVLTRLNQAFDYAVINGHIENNPVRILSAHFSRHFIVVDSTPRKSIVDIEDFKILLRDINGYNGDINVLNCLKWTIAYALRPSNARFAKWQDIDFKKKEWKIKGKDMKMNESFILPLTDAAIEFLKKQKEYNTQHSGYIFEGSKNNKALSENTMTKALKILGYGGKMDVHGFRSSLRTILSELNLQRKLGFSENVLSLCIDHRLRHVVRSDESYQRAKFELQKREIFDYWHSLLIEWGLEF